MTISQKQAKHSLNTYTSPQVTGTECHWNNSISIIHQTPTGRRSKEQDTVTRGPRMANTHSPCSISSPSHSLILVPAKSSPNRTTRITMNANLAKDIPAQGENVGPEGRRGKKICSKSLHTSVWAGLTSAPKPGLYQCEQKLANFFCQEPDNNSLNFLSKVYVSYSTPPL